MLKKIAIIGPESTGKSTLCEELARHYATLWCPEFAREYLLSYGKNYTYDDLLKIAMGQVGLEDEYIERVIKSESPEVRKTIPGNKKNTSGLPVFRSSLHPSLFIDTDMYVMKVWCEFVYGKCHRFILDQIVKRQYDLYLLCKTDLPWVKDELREYPDLETREKLYHFYKDIMINQAVPWVEISGSYPERFQKAITAVDIAMNS